jgi:hypothetical protein
MSDSEVRRTRSTFRATFVCGVVLACTALASPARGEPTAAEKSAARDLAIEGIKLADAGNCAEAIPKLERAERLHHAPTILGRLGECQVSVGKLVAGTESLQSVVREQLKPGAPPAFHAAQKRAEKVLEAALPRLSKLKISVKRRAGVEPSVTLDGAPVSTLTLDVPVAADPGSHIIEATASGFQKASTTVEIKEAGSVEATLELVPEIAPKEPVVAATASAPPPPASAPPPAPPRKEGSRIPTATYVLGGTGLVALAAGAVFGGLALGKKSSLDDACANKECPPDKDSDIDRMKTLGTLSTLGVGLGVVLISAGTVVYLVSPPSKETAASPVTVRVRLGAGAAALDGRF